MKKLLVTIVMVGFSGYGFSESSSNDFGRSDKLSAAISIEDFRERFEVIGKIFVTDGNGSLLFQESESRLWKFGRTGDLLSNWSFQSKNSQEIALRHVWSISKDRKILVHIQQFESMKRKDKGREVETGKLIREEKIEVKDFAPINWLAYSDSKKRVVVRLTPDLGDKVEMIKIDQFPISLVNPVVFDNQGRHWARGGSLEGRYISMKTHQGQFAVSYVPFKGAKEIGIVRGNEMVLEVDAKTKLYVKSDMPIISSGKPVAVYGIVRQDQKSDHVHSVHSSSMNAEKEFLESIQ